MAQQESETEELAKKTQNPVADLISVPLQNNFNFGAGFNHNKMIYALNVQPVIPVNLNEEWNLITRIIMSSKNLPPRKAPRARRETVWFPGALRPFDDAQDIFCGRFSVSKGVDQ